MHNINLHPLTILGPGTSRPAPKPTLAAYDMNELKLIYQVLHKQMLEHIELMDSQLFSELQTYLQSAAQRDGIDVTHHSAWDAWLRDSSATLAK